MPQGQPQAVPNSAGTAAPKTAAPENAADCHIHIYDPRFSTPGERPGPANATVADYRLLQKRIGVSRVVVVQPRNYGTDNSATVDAISQIGANARGVGVLRPDVTDAELAKLDAGGIRGIRFTLGDPSTAVVSIGMVEPLSQRIAALGWHVQLHVPPDQLVAHADMVRRLPSAIVIDHMGRLPQPAGTKHPAYRLIRELLDKGRTWVKLAAPLDAQTDYSAATAIARAWIAAAPERLVWGSNWPHPSETVKPDDAVCFDLLAEWAPDEAQRRRILVTNPEKLYGFSVN
jgi:predicted TIM-barrel fold metal-dependent hydrolase